MANKGSSTSFTKQNDKEKQSRLLNITKSDGTVVVWQKGSKSKENFTAFSFDKDKLLLTLRLSHRSNLGGKDVLYSFTLSGVNYFGQGKLRNIDKDGYKLECAGDLFKSERRETYRLLTYPHHNVYVHVPVSPEEIQNSNIVNINTGLSQTGLFNNFLDIVGEETQTKMIAGFMRFRVLDISVTGLAFQVTDLEKKFVEDGKILEPIILIFNGHQMEIPKAEVKYIIPLLNHSGKSFKVGLKFADMTINLDEELGGKINEALRDFDSEFEDFI